MSALVENNEHVEKGATCHHEVFCNIGGSGGILKKLRTVYGDGAQKAMAVYKWVARYKKGRETLEDDPHLGRLISTHNNENMKHIDGLLATN